MVSLFLRSWRATLIPAVAVVASLLGTLGVMYLVGFSLDNLSLMALTVATGFVVDDAIVVVENISRHIEDGVPPFEAALLGAREVGFTVLSISLSLIAVFIPLIFMGGLVGRLFREFALTMSIAVAISLVVSLTTTPMLAALVLDRRARTKGRVMRTARRGFEWAQARYTVQPRLGARQSRRRCLMLLAGTVALNVYLIGLAPKGFFPQPGYRRDHGRHPRRPVDLVPRHADEADPDREGHQVGPGGRHRGGVHRRLARGRRLSVRLAQAERQRPPIDQVIARLRPKLGADQRRHGVPQPGAGPAGGRPADQLDLPVRAEGRRSPMCSRTRRCG